MNEKYIKDTTESWEHVLSNEQDIVKLLKDLGLQDFKKIETILRTYSHHDGLVMFISAKDKRNKTQQIIIDATSGIPTWKQFINVTYYDGKATDLKIILYGKDYNEHSVNLSMNGFNDLSNLVRSNNKRGMKTYLVKGIEVNCNEQKAFKYCHVNEETNNVDINDKNIG